MNRNLLENLHQYFEQKENKTGEEMILLNSLTEELPFFQISSVCREDLEGTGFDTSGIDDSIMGTLADKLGDDYHEQLFWLSMEIIASSYCHIPKLDSNDDSDNDNT